MKKLVFITILFWAIGSLFGQSLQKGNLVGVHVAALKLKPGVTEEQAINFMLEKMIPAWEKTSGTKEYLMRGVKGKYAGRFATLTVFKDENQRNSIWADTPEARENLKKNNEAMKEVNSEADNYWYPFESTFNDYLIIDGKGCEIKKGAIIGLHNNTLKLNEGFTEKQYIDYCIQNILPSTNSYFQELVVVSASKSLRGEDSAQIGFFYYFPDENATLKLFDKDDNQTQFMKDYWIKYKDIWDGWSKIGSTESTFTDWIVL